jgi:hypothetical protein
MSHRFHETWIDNPNAIRTGRQKGPTTATVLDTVRTPTDDEQRKAGVFAASTAIRQGWTGELADVLDCLGIKP